MKKKCNVVRIFRTVAVFSLVLFLLFLIVVGLMQLREEPKEAKAIGSFPSSISNISLYDKVEIGDNLSGKSVFFYVSSNYWVERAEIGFGSGCYLVFQESQPDWYYELLDYSDSQRVYSVLAYVDIPVDSSLYIVDSFYIDDSTGGYGDDEGFYYWQTSSSDYQSGYSAGYQVGLAEGYENGARDGFNDGYDEGYAQGLVASSADAYARGYAAGQEDSEILGSSIRKFVFAVFDAPVNSIIPVLDFEYAGFDFAALFGFILAGILVIAIGKVLL